LLRQLDRAIAEETKLEITPEMKPRWSSMPMLHLSGIRLPNVRSHPKRM
jgi:hypothetical protein